jgi:hypothetical protein
MNKRRNIIVTSIVILMAMFAVVMFYSLYTYGAGSETRDEYAVVYKGDTKDYRFTVRNVYSSRAVNLTGFIVLFRVKKNVSDSSYVIDETCTIADAAEGLATVSLSASDTDLDTGDYFAYTILTNAGDTVYETLLKSKWKVVQ